MEWFNKLTNPQFEAKIEEPSVEPNEPEQVVGVRDLKGDEGNTSNMMIWGAPWWHWLVGLIVFIPFLLLINLVERLNLNESIKLLLLVPGSVIVFGIYGFITHEIIKKFSKK
ncbi:MAG: hypothetical protein Q8P13_00670 [bacterium]|nr:hypothetical protein [bacterium]